MYSKLTSRFHPFVRVVALLVLAGVLLAGGAAVRASAAMHTQALVGPKQSYLALGDSMAFGYQPDLDYWHGYVDDFFSELKGHGVLSLANMSCPGETSTTMIQGNCPYPFLRKYPYLGSQLDSALSYLQQHQGQVSPVTFNIGSNDLLADFNPNTCLLDDAKFNAGLAQLDANLTQIILPKLRAGLTVNGTVTGDIVMTNYYDPFENVCPNTLPYVRLVNRHLANDVHGYGIIVDTFDAFESARTPDPLICTYTWMCSIFKNIHATDSGYGVIASTFERGTGY